MTKRDFLGRYQGSLGGVFWSLLQPLFLLSVYTLAFGVILKARWGNSAGASQNATSDYALLLFSGLIFYNMLAECLTRAPNLIASNPNFVKKIVFPLELLPLISVLIALVHGLIALMIWLVGYGVLNVSLQPTSLFLPLILLVFFPVLLAVNFVLAALGILVKDIGQLIGLVTQTLLFLTPIFYSVASAPPLLQTLLKLNPLTFVIEEARQVLFFGQTPDFLGLALYGLLSFAACWLSLILFMRLRPLFADEV